MSDDVLSERQMVAEVEQIPASCVCAWSWRYERDDPARDRWVLVTRRDNCPWHGGHAA